MDWTMDWTMDWNMDWNMDCIQLQTANITKAMKGCLTVFLSFLACCGIVSTISERSEVSCIFNELQQ